MLDEHDKDIRREVKKQRRKDRHAKTQREEAVRALLGSPLGRDLLYWLLEQCNVGRQPFTANALTTSFACGELNVGLKLQDLIIEASPDGYMMMLKEKQNARSSSANDNAGDDGDSESDRGSDDLS
jgi:hypothetical protein